MHKIFTHKVKVYYEDTDAGGVVYYSNYLNFLERARTEAITSIGLTNKKIREDFRGFIIVKSCNIQYKISAYLEDELIINSFIKSVKKASFLMEQTIKKKKKIISKAEVHLVIVNDKGKPIKIPNDLFKKIKPYIEN
jgi:acyl-CoA thioester hydrolase